MKKISSIIEYLIDETIQMKDDYTEAVNAPIEFVCIFSQDNNEYKRLTDEIEKLGKVAQDTKTGFTYILNKALDTKAGPLRLVKIRKPDPNRKERGDADFNTDYKRFKEQYLNKPNFELVERKKFEMLRVSDPERDVLVCFSSKPLSKVIGVNK